MRRYLTHKIVCLNLSFGLPWWVEDLALSLQQLGSLLWCRFDPWPENFHMPRIWPKGKKKKKICSGVPIVAQWVKNLV